MKKFTLLLALLLLCGMSMNAQAYYSLKFERTGTDAASVKAKLVDNQGIVVLGSEDVQMTEFVSTSNTTANNNKFLNVGKCAASAENINGILCPNANGNANANIEMTFQINNLPEGFEFYQMGLFIHALNSAGNVQPNNGRNFSVKLEHKVEGTLATYYENTALDITSGSKEMLRNTDEKEVSAEAPLVIKLTVSSQSNGGCFFGLSEIRFYVPSTTINLNYSININGTPHTITVPTEVPIYTTKVAAGVVVPDYTKFADGESGERDIVAGVTEYTFNVVEDLPFVASENFDNAVWYTVMMRDDSDPRGGYWQYNGNGAFGTSAKSGPDTYEEKHLWAFVGNLMEGFKIYNKAAGASYTMKKELGNEGQASLAENADNALSTFFLVKGEGQYDGTIGFGLADDKNASGENIYLNVRGATEIKGWTYDIGCACKLAIAHFVELNASGITNVNNLATFSAPYAVKVPTGVTAYYGEELGTGHVKLTAIGEGAIPANEGVILESESTSVVMVEAAASDAVASISENKLSNTANGAKNATGEGMENAYILSGNANGAAFFKLGGGTIAANKAYLVIDAAPNSAVKMVFGGAVTGIESVEAVEADNTPVYDLSGRKVLAPAKGGIYVKGGKKFIVK